VCSFSPFSLLFVCCLFLGGLRFPPFPLSGGLEQNFRFLGVLRVCGFVLCRRVCDS
jgi:hypothetical protein